MEKLDAQGKLWEGVRCVARPREDQGAELTGRAANVGPPGSRGASAAFSPLLIMIDAHMAAALPILHHGK